MTSSNRNRHDARATRPIRLSLVIVIVFGGVGAAQAQWTADTSTNNIYYNAGKVGIGTSGPTQKLEVNGNIKISSGGLFVDNDQAIRAGGGDQSLIFRSSSNGIFVGSGDTNDFLVLNAGGYERLRLATNGNVGIGTTNPAQILDIKASTAIVTLQSTTGTSRTFFVAYNGGGHTYVGTENSAGNGIFNGDLAYASVFGTVDNNAVQFATNNTSRMTVDNGGNVGIGTTAPAGRLEVLGGAYSLPASSGTTQTGLVARLRDSRTSGDVVLDIGNAANANASWLQSVDMRNLSTNYALLLNPNGGNVGIGTTNPNVGKVHSVGDANHWSGYFLGSSTSGQSYGVLVDSGTNSSDNSFRVRSQAGAEYLLVRGDGNVGIGTTNPGYKLDVNGNTNVTGNLNITANGTGTGNIVAAGTINAKYQDLAEWVPSSQQLSAGTVVVLDSTKSNQVISSTVSYDTRVAGVVSEQPGIALGEKGESRVLVATTGRVRVRVDASKNPIHVGDLLVTSDVPGVAMKSEPVNAGGVQLHRPGTLIGKALEPLEKGSGKILVLLSLQ